MDLQRLIQPAAVSGSKCGFIKVMSSHQNLKLSFGEEVIEPMLMPKRVKFLKQHG